MITDTEKNEIKEQFCDRCMQMVKQVYILPVQEGLDSLGSCFYLCAECAEKYSIESLRFKRLFVKGIRYEKIMEDIGEETY